MESNPIRALSWKQPFGLLMLPPFNKIETRTWSTPYRGLVLMCASQTPYTNRQIEAIAGVQQFARIRHRIKDFKQFSGHAFAIGTLIDCRRMKVEDEDLCFVEYHPDRWCHIYDKVRAIEPTPFKGRQGWSILPNYSHENLKFL